MKDCKALGIVLAHGKCPQILNSPLSHTASTLLLSLKNHKKFKKMLTDLHPFHTKWPWENISPFCVFFTCHLRLVHFCLCHIYFFSPGLLQNGVCGSHWRRYILSLSSVFYHITVPIQPVMMATLHICPNMEWQYSEWTLRQTMDSRWGMLIMGEAMQVWRQRIYGESLYLLLNLCSKKSILKIKHQ